MSRLYKSLALIGLTLTLMAASCSSEREFTCSSVEGVGYHKITTWDCSKTKVEIINGKAYVKDVSKCTSKTTVYIGKYKYSRYTDSEGETFDFDAKDLINLGG
jgi:hypothetical protein